MDMRHMIDLVENTTTDYKIDWFKDRISGNPAAFFEVGGREYIAKFYDEFSYPGENGAVELENSVEAQFQENGKTGDVFGASGDASTGTALGVIRAMIQIIREYPRRKPVSYIGFTADFDDQSRVKLYDVMCRKLGGQKISGEAANVNMDFYVIKVN